MQSLVKASNITVLREGQTILRDVSLTVGEKDFITIIGPNGAGKSMLLKCLLGFYKADSGTIERRKDLKIGYVPQRFVADHAIPITTRRFLTLRKKPGTKALQRVVRETDIKDIMDKPLCVLSGGELQRVLLARALLDGPNLLVLDEPAQNLDITGQLAFYKLLEKIFKKNKISILMVSHDLHLVMSSTKQVVCLFQHICCSGEPLVVTKDPEFIALFGNDTARMMSVYHHTHDHKHEDHNHEGHNHD